MRKNMHILGRALMITSTAATSMACLAPQKCNNAYKKDKDVFITFLRGSTTTVSGDQDENLLGSLKRKTIFIFPPSKGGQEAQGSQPLDDVLQGE